MPKILPNNQDEKFKGMKGGFLDAIKKVEAKENDFKNKATKKNTKK